MAEPVAILSEIARFNRAEKFIAAARQLIGRPYVACTTGAFWPVDCLHVVIYAGKKIGYLPKDFRAPTYPDEVDPTLWAKFMPEWLDEVEPQNMGHGDIVILYEHLQREIEGIKPQPRHCGIIIAAPNPDAHWKWVGVSFSRNDPVVTEMPFHRKAQERIYKVYRLR